MNTATRRTALGIGAVVTALSLTACTGGSGGGGGGGGDGKVEITFMSFQAKADPVVKAFMDANPDISVKVSPPGGVYTDTLKTRIAGGQTPDVFQITAEGRLDILNNDLALDLSGEDFIDTVDPAFLALYTEDEAVYGITFTAWMGGIVYNKDLVKEAGFDEFPATIDDTAKLGETLVSQKVHPYFEDLTFTSPSLTAIVASSQVANGLSMADFPTDGKPSDETFVEAWTPAIDQWMRLVDSGFIAEEAVSLDGNQMKSSFINGQVAGYRSGNWDVEDLDASGINYGFAAFPAADGGVPFINGGGDPAFAISATSSPEKQAAAKKFLAFLASEEGVKAQTELTGALSISENFTSEPPAEFVYAYENSLRAGNYYWIEFSNKPALTIEAITANQQLVLQGKQTPEDFAKAIDAVAK